MNKGDITPEYTEMMLEKLFGVLIKNPEFLNQIEVPWSDPADESPHVLADKLFFINRAYLQEIPNNGKPDSHGVVRYKLFKKKCISLNIKTFSLETFVKYKEKFSDNAQCLRLLLRFCMLKDILDGRIEKELAMKFIKKLHLQLRKFVLDEEQLLQINHWEQIIPAFQQRGKCATLVLVGATKFEAQLVHNFILSTNSAEDKIVASSRYVCKWFSGLSMHLQNFGDFSIDYMHEFMKNYYYNARINDYKIKGNSQIVVEFFEFIFTEYLNYLPQEVRLFDTRVLSVRNYIKCIYDGYLIIHYNPFDKYPEHDKWKLLFLNNQCGRCPSTAVELNFSKVYNPILKECAKNFIWSDISSRHISLKFYPSFLAFLETIEKEEIVTDYQKITLETCYQLQNYIKAHYSSNSCTTLLNALRLFFLINDRKHITYDHNAEKFLIGGRVENTKLRVVKDVKESDLKITLNHLQSSGSEIDLITFYYLSVLLTVGIRGASINRLQVSDLIEKTSVNGYKEYSLRTFSKTNVSQCEEIPLSHKAARILKQAILATQPLRDKCNDAKIKNYIFLYENPMTKRIRTINSDLINKRINAVSKKISVKVTPKQFRDFYMAEAIKASEEKNMDIATTKTLTLHATIGTLRTNYDCAYDAVKVVELLYNAEVNPVVIKGQIVKSIKKDKSQITNEGLGYCENKKCTQHIYHPCVLCKHFVTSPDEIENFELAIKQIDKDLESEALLHEREFLLKRKEVYVSYLSRLLPLQEESKKRGAINI